MPEYSVLDGLGQVWHLLRWNIAPEHSIQIFSLCVNSIKKSSDDLGMIYSTLSDWLLLYVLSYM